MNTNIQVDLKVAMQQFKKRQKANKGKQIDNSRLPAGASMYFYCKCCGAQTDVLPESYTCTPKQMCEPCEVLRAHGLV